MTIKRVHFTPDATLKALEAGHRAVTDTISGSVIPDKNGNLLSIGGSADIWMHLLWLLRQDAESGSETALYSAALRESIINLLEEMGRDT